MKKDEWAYVLDYLPKGKQEVPPHKRKPVAQVVGENFFTLLEVTPREGMALENGDKIYIGEDTREHIDHIDRRIKYEWLTPTAKSELPYVLRTAVEDHEQRFLEFYNTAGIISTRQHKLETLPKIGKKSREEILEEREIEKFESFQDMRQRVRGIDPVKAVSDKILEEMKGESKYLLFTPMLDKKDRRR
ncbi:MAG: DUF655 domain-containing protein [Candidatus Altiarchaeales archaeon]|nr:DUF655 domain-containing protein [Candidatus Altiarchaeales archaeon]